MKKLALSLVAAIMLAGCATQQQLNMKNDWRTGTDQSPYRSIAPAIICDDCAVQ